VAYVGTTNTLIANGGSADYLFVIKQSLVSAGWTLLSCSNGVTLNTGTPATDNLTTAAQFNVNNAWCRLREPSGAGGREFILLHGAANGNTALVKYSRSTGFSTGGTATTCSTTGVGGDGQLIVAAGTASLPTWTDQTATSATQAIQVCGSTGYVQCVANNAAVNGVYGFWAFQYAAGGSAIGAACLFQEPAAPGSTPTGDNDPSARYYIETNAGSTPSIVGNVSTTVSNTTTYRGWSYWNAYGLGGAAYVRNRGANVYVQWNNTTGNFAGISFPTVAAGSLSPYDGKVSMLPLLLGGASISDIVLWKGFSSSLLTFATTQNFADTFNLSSADPRIAVQVGPAGSCAIPWVTGIVPTV
jgi:hypothetical protein